MKRCPRCLADKEVNQFSRSQQARDGLQSLCKPCHVASVMASYHKNKLAKLAYIAKWTSENVDKVKRNKYRYKLKTKYGITLEQYEEMLVAQNGACAICETAEPGRGRWFFCVDHDHATGRIRGLLCQNCNDAIARLDDSVDTLINALIYLLSASTNLRRFDHRNRSSAERTYQRLVLLVEEACAICGSDKPRGTHSRLIMDHDHRTEMVRGILCGDCNEGVGKFGDNPVLVSHAIHYLQQPHGDY